MTRTYAILDVSPAAYDEIEAKLRSAGYEHAIDEVIDMHGLALRRTPLIRTTSPHELTPRQLTDMMSAAYLAREADAYAVDVARKLSAKVDAESDEPPACGCPSGSHPPRHNYLHGEAERYGKVCSLGWSLEER